MESVNFWLYVIFYVCLALIWLLIIIPGFWTMAKEKLTEYLSAIVSKELESKCDEILENQKQIMKRMGNGNLQGEGWDKLSQPLQAPKKCE